MPTSTDQNAITERQRIALQALFAGLPTHYPERLCTLKAIYADFTRELQRLAPENADRAPPNGCEGPHDE